MCSHHLADMVPASHSAEIIKPESRRSDDYDFTRHHDTPDQIQTITPHLAPSRKPHWHTVFSLGFSSLTSVFRHVPLQRFPPHLSLLAAHLSRCLLLSPQTLLDPRSCVSLACRGSKSVVGERVDDWIRLGRKACAGAPSLRTWVRLIRKWTC